MSSIRKLGFDPHVTISPLPPESDFTGANSYSGHHAAPAAAFVGTRPLMATPEHLRDMPLAPPSDPWAF